MDKVLKSLAIFCFATIIIFNICGFVVSPNLNLFSETARAYDEDWIRENQDGTITTYKMPLSLNLKKGETISMYTILPDDVESGMYLAMHTGKSFTMQVDGREIYSFDNTISKLPGNITKTIIIPVPLEEEYAGKKLTMNITDGMYERPTINTAYIGGLLGILAVIVKNYAIQFVMALLLILAAILTIIIFAYIGKRDNQRASLIYLAEGILLICLWIVCDSPIFQLVFGAYFFDGITGFMLVTTMALPFLLYFDAITEGRNHYLYVVGEIMCICNFIVLTFLHLTGIRSYDKSLVYVDLMLLVYILTMIISTLGDYFRRKDGKHKYVVFGLIGLSVFSFLEIVVTIVNAYATFKVDIGGLCVLVGMVLLLMFAIIDQIQVYEVLKQETQNALAATKAKSDFLANMSHEIRTPINAIMGMNEMVLRESNQDNVKDYAKDISSASENLLRIVNDILDLSKIESGKLEIVCDNYNLGELIYDVTTLVNMKAENKGLKLNIKVNEDLPAVLYGDDKRVREIITNILNNAVKYTEEGHVDLDINGDINDSTVDLHICIADSGQGIRKEDLLTIFDGFSQVNIKKNKKIEGTGLGLSITKQLVELMGGNIEVESEFGKGSVFTVILPQKIVSEERLGKYLSHRHASADEAETKAYDVEVPEVNILVVDDTALNLKVISKFLSTTKANTTCASSGEEMLKLIQENEYDIIFLDHMMPNMDGIETLQASRDLENNKCMNTPIIALTANAIVGAKEMYLEAGFDDYLSKPIKINELCDAIIKHTVTMDDNV